MAEGSGEMNGNAATLSSQAWSKSRHSFAAKPDPRITFHENWFEIWRMC